MSEIAIPEEDDGTLVDTLCTTVLAAATVLLLSSILLILVQAAYAADVGLARTLGEPLWDVLGTDSGKVWIVRMVLIAALLVVGWGLKQPVGRPALVDHPRAQAEPLAWSVPSEVVVATVLLLVVGILTSIAPG